VKRSYPVAVKVAAAALVAVAALGASAVAGARSTVTFCSAAQLKGTFNVVRGSAGAGNIVYRLSVTNVSQTECSLTGTPVVRLLGKTGTALPTHVMPTFRPGLTAILVRVAPGKGAHATARFSPDVPGPGEPTSGKQCEPTAYTLRISAPNGGTLKAPIKPVTPVCEHGTLQMSVYGYGR
jgi:hypothetical protein